MEIVMRFLAFKKEISAENIHSLVKTGISSLQNGSSPVPCLKVLVSISPSINAHNLRSWGYKFELCCHNKMEDPNFSPTFVETGSYKK